MEDLVWFNIPLNTCVNLLVPVLNVIFVCYGIIKRNRQTDRQTGGEAGKDLNLKVHLPALSATAVTTRQTKQMIVLLTTDKTRAASGHCPQTLHTDTHKHVILLYQLSTIQLSVSL